MNPSVFHRLSYGVYIVSTWDGQRGRPTGCVANSIMQVTSKPATLAISINRDNYTWGCIGESGRLAVSILSQGTEPSIIGRFGFSSGRDTSKFEGIPYVMKGDVPVVDDSCGWMTCRVIDRLDAGSHTVFLAEVLDGEPQGDTPPMTYSYYHTVIKGKTAKNAPTYLPEMEEQTGTVQPGAAHWRCTVCGYEHLKQPPFETLPDSWVCPVCGAGKDKFERI